MIRIFKIVLNLILLTICGSKTIAQTNSVSKSLIEQLSKKDSLIIKISNFAERYEREEINTIYYQNDTIKIHSIQKSNYSEEKQSDTTFILSATQLDELNNFGKSFDTKSIVGQEIWISARTIFTIILNGQTKIFDNKIVYSLIDNLLIAQNEQETINFFAWRTDHKNHPNEMKIKRVNEDVLLWESYDLNFLSRDTLFNQEEKVFFKAQLANINSKTIWDKTYFKKLKMFKYAEPKQTNSRNAYKDFSIPLFSKNMRYCIMKEEYVSGPISRDRATFIYEKIEDGKWKLVKKIGAIST